MKGYWWPLLLAIALAAGWWLGGRLQETGAERLAPDPGCDLSGGSCARQLPDGRRMTLNLAPVPPRVMIPLDLELALEGPASAVWVDFAGLNMDMGVNRAELARHPEGLWRGQVILPICSSAEMHWEAQVFVASEGGLLQVPFRFVTRP